MSLAEKRNEIMKRLDMKSKAQLLLATREDLEKCKTKNSELSDHTINELYEQYAESLGFTFENWWDEAINNISNVKKFRTGEEVIDGWLKKGSELWSDELIEIMGSSAGGKTTLALKIAALALIEKDADVIYIDTSNYLNSSNTTALLSQILTGYDSTTSAMNLLSCKSHLHLHSVYSLENLILFLSTLVEIWENPPSSFVLPNIVFIDSLSALTCAVSQRKILNEYLKEVLTLIKILNKKFYVMVVITENVTEGATKVSEIERISYDIGTTIEVGVDKTIYCSRSEDGVNYVVVNK